MLCNSLTAFMRFNVLGWTRKKNPTTISIRNEITCDGTAVYFRTDDVAKSMSWVAPKSDIYEWLLVDSAVKPSAFVTYNSGDIISGAYGLTAGIFALQNNDSGVHLFYMNQYKNTVQFYSTANRLVSDYADYSYAATNGSFGWLDSKRASSYYFVSDLGKRSNSLQILSAPTIIANIGDTVNATVEPTTFGTFVNVSLENAKSIMVSGVIGPLRACFRCFGMYFSPSMYCDDSYTGSFSFQVSGQSKLSKCLGSGINVLFSQPDLSPIAEAYPILFEVDSLATQ